MSLSTFNWQDRNALRLYAQDWHPAEPPRGVVSLVHGIGEHIGRYQHVAETLNAAGFGLVGFDLPGHGRSEGKRGHAAYDDILVEIDHLLAETALRYPNLPQFLYGHSLGGALVLYYILKRQPELNGVISTSPSLATYAPVPAAKLTLAKIMARVAPSFTMDNGLEVNYLSRDPAVIQAYKEDPLVHPKVSARLGLDLLTKGAWIQNQAPQFPRPLLLVQGSADHLISTQANTTFAKAAQQDKITFKVWEGLYHETHNEFEKQQVLHYMIDWLSQHL
jgi:alpha-beta hydrolase superfamily lysophospholipase